MPLYMRTELPRVLEDDTITRVGGNTPIKVNVRTIFATAKDLEHAAAVGEFRKDLYYRINVAPIALPRLREHGDDNNMLTQHFMRLHAQHHDKSGLTI